MPENYITTTLRPTSSTIFHSSSGSSVNSNSHTISESTTAELSSCVPTRPLPIGQLASLLQTNSEITSSKETLEPFSNSSKNSWNSVIGMGSTSSLLVFPDDMSRSTSAPPSELIHVPSSSSPSRNDKGLERPKASVIGPSFTPFASNTNIPSANPIKGNSMSPSSHQNFEVTSHPNYAAYYYSRSRMNPRLPPPVYTPGQSWHHLWNSINSGSSSTSTSSSNWPFSERKNSFQSQSSSNFSPISELSVPTCTEFPSKLNSVEFQLNGNESNNNTIIDETEHIKATLRHLSLDCSIDFPINRQLSTENLNNITTDKYDYENEAFDADDGARQDHQPHLFTDMENTFSTQSLYFSDETSNLFNSFRPYSSNGYVQNRRSFFHNNTTGSNSGNNFDHQSHQYSHLQTRSKYPNISTINHHQSNYLNIIPTDLKSKSDENIACDGNIVSNRSNTHPQLYKDLESSSQSDTLSTISSPTSLLEEFRASKGTRRFSVKEILSCVVEFSGDQFGSRFIQQKLESCTPEEKDMIFNEMLPHAVSLMTDVFGNYVIQKFFELGSLLQRKSLAKNMQGHVIDLSLQMYGCRVVQKALENLPADSQSTLIQELSGHVIKCVKDQNGNHVIQKCIERVPSHLVQFIVDSFKGQVCHLAMHPYGCRVLQRIFEHCAPLQSSPLLSELYAHVDILVLDQYGNYVIQHVLERGSSMDRSKVIKSVKGRLLELSRHKFASNVVEKSMAYAEPPDRKALVDEILTGGSSTLTLMMKDPFANYVVQRMLDVADEHQRTQLVMKIKPQLAMLRKYTYGKHIITKVERILSAMEGRVSGY